MNFIKQNFGEILLVCIMVFAVVGSIIGALTNTERSMQCKKGHFEKRDNVQLVGKTSYMKKTTYFVCDEV